MKYCLTTPCPRCPFRSDIEGYLRADRVREIEEGLERGEFACHKTVEFAENGDEEEHAINEDEQQHCAGALILLEKLGRSSQMMRICERVGLYDHTRLNMAAPVFDSFDDMEAAQSQ